MRTKSLAAAQRHQELLLVAVHVQQDLQLSEVRLLLVLRQVVQVDVQVGLLLGQAEVVLRVAMETIIEVIVVLVQVGLLLEAEEVTTEAIAVAQVGLLLEAEATAVAVQVDHLLVAEAVLLAAAEVAVQALLVVDEVTKKLSWFSKL